MTQLSNVTTKAELDGLECMGYLLDLMDQCGCDVPIMVRLYSIMAKMQGLAVKSACLLYLPPAMGGLQQGLTLPSQQLLFP